MWIHLRCTADPANGQETYKIAFDTFAAFLYALNCHFGDPDKKHTASLTVDKLRQSNREFGASYADFQELMDILETTDDTLQRYALKRGLNHGMLCTLAIFPASKAESFDAYVERLNELDCHRCALNTHSRRQPQHQPHHIHLPTTATVTGIAARPIDMSVVGGKLSTTERSHLREPELCMYCGGVGHFSAECPAR